MSRTDSRHTAVLLRAAMSALHRQLRLALPPTRIGVARLSVLSQLYRGGPMTPTDLAAREHVRLQTLTRLLAELEADEWISRASDPDDGRRTRLSLTKLGARQLTDDVHRREASLAAAIERTLSPSQRAVVAEACGLLDRIADALATVSGADGARDGREAADVP